MQTQTCSFKLSGPFFLSLSLGLSGKQSCRRTIAPWPISQPDIGKQEEIPSAWRGIPDCSEGREEEWSWGGGGQAETILWPRTSTYKCRRYQNVRQEEHISHRLDAKIVFSPLERPSFPFLFFSPLSPWVHAWEDTQWLWSLLSLSKIWLSPAAALTRFKPNLKVTTLWNLLETSDCMISTGIQTMCFCLTVTRLCN